MGRRFGVVFSTPGQGSMIDDRGRTDLVSTITATHPFVAIVAVPSPRHTVAKQSESTCDSPTSYMVLETLTGAVNNVSLRICQLLLVGRCVYFCIPKLHSHEPHELVDHAFCRCRA
jgi:hypothetical protein